MTNDEIRARIDDYQRQIKEYGYLVVYDSIWMTNTIEALLARQAEALALAKEKDPDYSGDGFTAGWTEATSQFRAILDPQELRT